MSYWRSAIIWELKFFKVIWPKTA